MVQRMLGHKSATQTLDRYGHLFPNELGEVMDRVSDARARAVEARSRIPTRTMRGPWNLERVAEAAESAG